MLRNSPKLVTNKQPQIQKKLHASFLCPEKILRRERQNTLTLTCVPGFFLDSTQISKYSLTEKIKPKTQI